ncbi:hypothetical protein [Labedaea rhizosphaerae]|nr:hypothetical protein [Labedaea rhizosphaerae]
MFVNGFTFRWVKGDRYVAVMRGTCVDQRRVYIFSDHFNDGPVFETPQPLIDAIPAPHTEWADDSTLRQLIQQWLAKR